MVIAKIISVGDELLNGQVNNTNATFISERLKSIGIFVHKIVVIGDKEVDLLKELEDSGKKFDLTIITGGLGPTHDDITKFVLIKYFNDTLKLSNEVLEHIKGIFRKKGLSMPEINVNQAYLPEKSEFIWNKEGTAPGIIYNMNGNMLIALPGVPYEMKAMVEDYLIPRMKEYFKNKIGRYYLSRTILTTGISESALAELIGKVDDIVMGNKLAFLPSYMGVRLRVDVESDSCKQANIDLDTIVNKLYSIAGDFIYGFDSDLLEEIVGNLLINRSASLSVAESCTGGLLSKRLTDIPGSSRYYAGGICTYSNELKIRILGVSDETIEEYGAVSEKTAVEMALGVRNLFGTDYSLSITGIAGPEGGSNEKPVGVTYIGYCDAQKNFAVRFNFGDNRERNRIRASQAALNILRKELNRS